MNPVILYNKVHRRARYTKPGAGFRANWLEAQMLAKNFSYELMVLVCSIVADVHSQEAGADAKLDCAITGAGSHA
jgi:hypothetical protein